MKIFRNICRILLGLVFIFSGFVKAVDPLGSQYKFNEYFLSFGWDWFIPAALVFGIILFTVEFFLGFIFLFNIKIKQFSWLMLLFMLFFLVLTFVLALTNKVTDCGCFGDAIKMTNWQTFYKNVFLIVLVLVVFFTRKKFVNKFHGVFQLIVAMLGLGIVLGIGIYSLCHLPIIDFMPWKKGAVISEQVVATPEIADIFLVYKNKETGETLEYTSKTLPWKDTVFFKKLEFIDQKKKITQEYKEAPIHDFMIEDDVQVQHNAEIVANPNWQFLLISYDLDKAEKSVFDQVNKFAELCEKDSISFVGLSGSVWQTIDYFRHDVKAKFKYYTVDETALKSVVRSNPGLVLLKEGVVIDKWAWRDLPTYEEFKASQPEYLKFLEKVKTEKAAKN
jgi:hypothetical protein